ALELRPLMAGVGIELDQERESAEEARHQQRAAVAILDVGGMHDRVHQQPLGIDEDVPLLALDLLARIVAGRIDAGPPHMGCFQSSSFICAGRWRVTREAGRSAAEQGAKRPCRAAAGYTVTSERAPARSWLPLRSLRRSFILPLRISFCVWIRSVSPSLPCS